MMDVRFAVVRKNCSVDYIVLPFDGGDVIPFILDTLEEYIRGNVPVHAVDVESLKVSVPVHEDMSSLTSDLYAKVNYLNKMGDFYYDN